MYIHNNTAQSHTVNEEMAHCNLVVVKLFEPLRSFINVDSRDAFEESLVEVVLYFQMN